MRSRILPAVGLSVGALALGATFAPMASASHGAGVAGKTPVHSLTHAKVSAKSCYNQADNDNGIGIVSQNFESSFDQYDAQGADDLKLKKKCKLKVVHADGVYFNGSGPADSFDVTFYKDGGTTPGATKKTCAGASYTDTGFGSPDIKCKGKLKGSLWVSVVANLNFSTGGEWGWNTNNTQRGDAAAWQNPGGGFGTGCSTWGNMITCLGALGQGPDFSFSLN